MKKIITLCLSLCLTAALAAPAYALEYSNIPLLNADRFASHSCCNGRDTPKGMEV